MIGKFPTATGCLSIVIPNASYSLIDYRTSGENLRCNGEKTSHISGAMAKRHRISQVRWRKDIAYLRCDGEKTSYISGAMAKRHRISQVRWRKDRISQVRWRKDIAYLRCDGFFETTSLRKVSMVLIRFVFFRAKYRDSFRGPNCFNKLRRDLSSLKSITLFSNPNKRNTFIMRNMQS